MFLVDHNCLICSLFFFSFSFAKKKEISSEQNYNRSTSKGSTQERKTTYCQGRLDPFRKAKLQTGLVMTHSESSGTELGNSFRVIHPFKCFFHSRFLHFDSFSPLSTSLILNPCFLSSFPLFKGSLEVILSQKLLRNYKISSSFMI